METLFADGVAGFDNLIDSAFHGVFHDCHAAPDRILHQLKLLEDKDVDRAACSISVFLGGAEDLFGMRPGLGDDAMLRDEIIGPITGDLQDAGALVLGLTQNALALPDHALCLPDLVWNRGSQLIDECEKVLFFDHDAATEGDALADSNKFFEAIDKVENVGGAVLRWRWCAALCHAYAPKSRKRAFSLPLLRSS